MIERAILLSRNTMELCRATTHAMAVQPNPKAADPMAVVGVTLLAVVVLTPSSGVHALSSPASPGFSFDVSTACLP